MSFETIARIGYGGQGLNDRLPRILAELQGLTISGPLTGVASSAPIVDANGPDLQDTLLKMIYQTTAAANPVDITATASIIDVRPTGNITLTTGLADGDTVAANGKTYTAKSITPSPTSANYGPQQFSTGKQADGATTLTALQLLSMNLFVPPANGIGPFVPLTVAQATALAAGAAINIAALSLANAINTADALLLTAAPPAALNSGVCNIWADAETTAGNAFTLNNTGSNAHATVSGATLSGGLFGQANGTITLAAAAVADTITIAGTVFTARAPGSVLAPTDFVGGTVTVQDLQGVGFTTGQANTLITAGNNNAAAAILAHQINAAIGGTQATAVAALAVVNLTSVSDGAAGAAVTLVSSTGVRLAVSGAGTLTAPSRGWKNTVATNGPGTVLVTWYKKSRVVGQW